MTSRRCIGVTRARSFCVIHAPDLESRIDCSSLGSPDVAVEFFAVEFLRLNFLWLIFHYFQLFFSIVGYPHSGHRIVLQSKVLCHKLSLLHSYLGLNIGARGGA